jgi:hypothetical protein
VAKRFGGLLACICVMISLVTEAITVTNDKHVRVATIQRTERVMVQGRILAIVHYDPPKRTVVIVESVLKDDDTRYHVLLLPHTPSLDLFEWLAVIGEARSFHMDAYERLRLRASQLSMVEQTVLREVVDVINGHHLLHKKVYGPIGLPGQTHNAGSELHYVVVDTVL